MAFLARGKNKCVVSFPEPGVGVQNAPGQFLCVRLCASSLYGSVCLWIALPLGTQIGVCLYLLSHGLCICVYKYLYTPVFGV